MWRPVSCSLVTGGGRAVSTACSNEIKIMGADGNSQKDGEPIVSRIRLALPLVVLGAKLRREDAIPSPAPFFTTTTYATLPRHCGCSSTIANGGGGGVVILSPSSRESSSTTPGFSLAAWPLAFEVGTSELEAPSPNTQYLEQYFINRKSPCESPLRKRNTPKDYAIIACMLLWRECWKKLPFVLIFSSEGCRVGKHDLTFRPDGTQTSDKHMLS